VTVHGNIAETVTHSRAALGAALLPIFGFNYAKALMKAEKRNIARPELEARQSASNDFGKSEIAGAVETRLVGQRTVVAVVGLGYVGLPLAVEFGKKYRTVGLDISAAKIDAYLRHVDPTGELSRNDLAAATLLEPTTDAARLRDVDFIVVAVPTPIDEAHQPDFDPLINASLLVGRNLKQGATVVFESTVYPGATEEICIPIIERESHKRWKRDFFVGYSPERINPGDREHTLTRIVKVVAGDTPETLERVASMYDSIIGAGVYRASSIKVAEAAKVIENTQRDLNIALMNELSLIFHRMDIDTTEVLEAAGTKWNFLPFRPGLVGGHCIGVDPYYLTHKADKLGYHPQVILAGRRINDGMGKFIAEQTVKSLIQSGVAVKGADVIVLGLTFKENCPDLRNSKVIDVIRELESYGVSVSVHDPVADSGEALAHYGLRLVPWDELPRAHALVAAVAHQSFRDRPVDELMQKLAPGALYVDVKCQADAAVLRERGLTVWRL
jgi:UDP-N-acetyl-D-galactosamine dehydrogenase